MSAIASYGNFSRSPKYRQNKTPHIETNQNRPLLVSIDIQIPVTVLTRACRIHLNLASLSEDNSEESAKDDEHVRMLESINAWRHPENADEFFYNNKAHTLKDLSDDGSDCTISISISDYFSFLVRHDAMEFELLTAIPNLDDELRGVEHPHDTPPYPFTPLPTSAHNSRANVLICVGDTENLNSNVVMMKSARESRHATSGRKYLLGEFDCKDLWLALSSNWS